MIIVCISTRRSFPLMTALLGRGIICKDEVHVPMDHNEERASTKDGFKRDGRLQAMWKAAPAKLGQFFT